jgi:hypothetical protein
MAARRSFTPVQAADMMGGNIALNKPEPSTWPPSA